MVKKIISLFLCIFIIASMLAVCHITASSNAEVTVESVEVKQGTTNASVKINLKNNPGLVFAKFQVSFGSELTLINVVDGGILGNATHSNNKVSPYILYWNNGTATQDFVGNGTVATLDFTIPSNIPVGTYPITISVNQGSTFNFADEDVKINTVNGKISVVSNNSATYAIKYNANGGSNPPASQTKTHNVALTLSSTKPTRSGYTFMGWSTSANGAVEYSAGASFTKNANTTLYAVWKKDNISVTTYTISYDANGGIGAPAPQVAEYGANIKITTDEPTRSGYTFMGWAVAPDTAVMCRPGMSYRGNSNMKLYAVWKNNSYLGAPKLVVSSENAVKGSLVDVTISLGNIDSPAAVNYSLYFDSTAMKPVAFSIGSSCTCCQSNVRDPLYDPSTNSVTVVAMGLYHGIKKMTITFEILDDAPKGTYQIIPTMIDALNCIAETVECTTESGKITVRDGLVGDITGDGRIDTRDAVLLAQYLANWSVSIDKAMADCNADGYVDTRDAVLLAQYLANWSVTLG